MNWSKEISISNDFFKEVKFFLTGQVNDKVIDLLLRGGAKQELHITDFITILIVGENPNQDEISEAKDIYEKPAVHQRWVILSAIHGQFLSYDGFLCHQQQLFSGIVGCISQLKKHSVLSIWALINYYGGSCTLDFDKKCTHLVIGGPDGDKYRTALKYNVFNKDFHIVTPDWVTDSIYEGKLKDETLYHPCFLVTEEPLTPTRDAQLVTQSMENLYIKKEPILELISEVIPEVKKGEFDDEESKASVAKILKSIEMVEASTKAGTLDDKKSFMEIGDAQVDTGSLKLEDDDKKFFETFDFSDSDEEKNKNQEISLFEQIAAWQTMSKPKEDRGFHNLDQDGLSGRSIDVSSDITAMSEKKIRDILQSCEQEENLRGQDSMLFIDQQMCRPKSDVLETPENISHMTGSVQHTGRHLQTSEQLQLPVQQSLHSQQTVGQLSSLQHSVHAAVSQTHHSTVLSQPSAVQQQKTSIQQPHQLTMKLSQQPHLLQTQQSHQMTLQQSHPAPLQHVHQSPMQQPHQSPIQQPHLSPMQQPHQSPMQQPHQSPMQQPHQSPMQQPHQSPMQQPHQSPMQQPHQSPMQQPHQSPMQQPHQSPMQQPHHSPMQQPHQSPMPQSPMQQPLPSPMQQPQQSPMSQQSQQSPLHHSLQPSIPPHQSPMQQPHHSPMQQTHQSPMQQSHQSPMPQPQQSLQSPMQQPLQSPIQQGSLQQQQSLQSPLQPPLSSPIQQSHQPGLQHSLVSHMQQFQRQPVQPSLRQVSHASVGFSQTSYTVQKASNQQPSQMQEFPPHLVQHMQPHALQQSSPFQVPQQPRTLHVQSKIHFQDRDQHLLQMQQKQQQLLHLKQLQQAKMQQQLQMQSQQQIEVKPQQIQLQTTSPSQVVQQQHHIQLQHQASVPLQQINRQSQLSHQVQIVSPQVPQQQSHLNQSEQGHCQQQLQSQAVLSQTSVQQQSSFPQQHISVQQIHSQMQQTSSHVQAQHVQQAQVHPQQILQQQQPHSQLHDISQHSQHQSYLPHNVTSVPVHSPKTPVLVPTASPQHHVTTSEMQSRHFISQSSDMPSSKRPTSDNLNSVGVHNSGSQDTQLPPQSPNVDSVQAPLHTQHLQPQARQDASFSQQNALSTSTVSNITSQTSSLTDCTAATSTTLVSANAITSDDDSQAQVLPSEPSILSHPNNAGTVQHSPNVAPVSHAEPSAVRHVHTVAFPEAVVRVPQGVTHQQLQRMTQDERYQYFQKLKQQQLGRHPGKPQLGHVGIKYAPPATVQVRGPATGGIWAQGPQQVALRPGVLGVKPATTYASTQVKVQQDQASATVAQNWTRPQLAQPQYAPSQVNQAGRVVQGAWQQQQPMPLQVPVGTSPAPSQSGTPQQVLHPQQVQNQIQHLCQQFPSLTVQEAQQLIQRLPVHLRHIHQLDNAQQSDYLNQLEANERRVVTFYLMRRRHAMQRQQLQQQQVAISAQQKVATPQQSPHSWPQHSPQQQQQPQFSNMAVNATPNRPITQQGFPSQNVVSPGQGSPHMAVAAGSQMAPHLSPLPSPHGHSPLQTAEGQLLPPGAIQGSTVPQNIANQQTLVNPKTKTALANLLTNRLSSGHQGSIEVPPHLVQKHGVLPETVPAGSGGEQVMIYQRRTLSNITGSVTNNLVRPPIPAAVHPPTAPTGYQRTVSVGHPASQTIAVTPSGAHYHRPHLYGHDSHTMLPRELCLVGCVFYIADYYSEVLPEVIEKWKRIIHQHGGEVVLTYDSVKVTHILCKNQKSPVLQQALRDYKRCITIFWLNDILLRGKTAPPWQAIHLPTPFGLEGVKVNKAREWNKPVVNGFWLSEVLLGQNTPPLVYQGARYQQYLEDSLRIDPSLASHLFHAWQSPISVSKEAVEKAKAVREVALRKRKAEAEEQQNKKARVEAMLGTHLSRITSSRAPHLPPESSGASQNINAQQSYRGPLNIINKELPPEYLRPRVLISHMLDKEEIEKKLQELGAHVCQSYTDASHLVMGAKIAQRTFKFMCAFSTCKYLLSVDWVLDSHAQAKFLDEENYFLRMPLYEKVHRFSLRESIKKPNRNKLFSGKLFYLTPSVIPGRTWLKEIIESADGTVENKRKSLKDIKELNKDQIKYIIISVSRDLHLLKDVICANISVYRAEFVMSSIFRQELSFDDDKLLLIED